MRTLINELIETYDKFDEFKHQLESYHNFVQSENGKFVQDVFFHCQTRMVKALLSLRFTKLSPTEKDVEQRTIYQINQMLEFLMAPMRVINEKKAKRIKPNLMGAVNKSNKEGNKNGR